MSGVVMGLYAGCEILFPAWVTQRWGADRMAVVLLLGCGGYATGFALWRVGFGRYWRSSGRGLLWMQGLILMGAGVPMLASTPALWFAGVFGFSVGLPVVTAALHQAWLTLAQQENPARLFALRYCCEWSSRLIAFLSVSLLVDRVLAPNLVVGAEVLSGQSLALMLSALGFIALVTLLLDRWGMPSDGASIN